MGTNQRAAIVMTPAEVTQFLSRSRTATVASLGPDGLPHLVAMWYGIIGDAVYIETKAKSQKAVNLRRDPRMVVMVEAGTSYDELRGVSLRAPPRSSRSPTATSTGPPPGACTSATPAPTPTRPGRCLT